jgi:hypothetical protein
MASGEWGNEGRGAGFEGTGLEDVRARLAAIAEELADLGRARLSRALQEEEGGEPGAGAQAAAEERKLASARRAVLRALAALGGEPDD